MKINLTLNLSKLDKSKIIDNVYKDKDGNEVKEKLYKMEVVDLKLPKFVTEGATWKMLKTHFAVDPQTKEEREAKKPANFIGEGFTFESKVDNTFDALEDTQIHF